MAKAKQTAEIEEVLAEVEVAEVEAQVEATEVTLNEVKAEPAQVGHATRAYRQ